MNRGNIDAVDEFLAWQDVGFGVVRELYDAPFRVDDERLQTEYPLHEEVPRAVRAGWHPMINQLYLYWRSKFRDAGNPPNRRDMDPLLEIPLLCPHVCIFEPVQPASTSQERGQVDWYGRIVGTKVEEALGFFLTGRRVSDFMADLDHPQTLRYGLVAIERQISHRRGPARTPVEYRYGWAESLYLPIIDSRRGTKAAFGMAIYQWLPA